MSQRIDTELPKHYGLQESTPNPKDFVLGSSGSQPQPLSVERDYTNHLPTKEYQFNDQFDTWACVSFAVNNAHETYAKAKHSQLVNKSDRFLAVVSGTKIGWGNTLDRVAQADRENGFVYEETYPFVQTRQEYYQAIPPHILNEGLVMKSVYEAKYGWVDWAGCDPEKLWNGLQYTPLTVSVFAWEKPKNGVYQRTEKSTNHLVMLFKAEYGKYWYIYDHYDSVVKKLAWDFRFGSSMWHTFDPINVQETIAKKYAGQFIKNADDSRVYYSDGRTVAWITGEAWQFLSDILDGSPIYTIQEPIETNSILDVK